MDYDVAIIGGGPGGYVAAIRAARLGAKTLLLEKDAIGGTCLNIGCIPTKTLAASAARFRDMQNCREFGLTADNIGVDFAAVMSRKAAVTKQLATGAANLVKGNGVDCLRAAAEITADKTVIARGAEGERQIRAGKIIIATGSAPVRPPIPGGDLPGVLDSSQLLNITSLPGSLAIIGGGVIGLEFASIFQAFGCAVTVIEMLPNILNGMDKDIITRMGLSLRKQGVKFITSGKVREITANVGGLTVNIETAKGEQAVTAQTVLMAAGRAPYLTGLGLDAAGIAYGRQGITVNERLETNIDGIYAIGDVTGRAQLAHAASAAGLTAAENACGLDSRMDFDNIPACVFTLPEAAGVGLTEQQAGERAAVGKFNFAGNGKAMAMGETDGFVKLIADKDSGRLLGMHVLGPHASDLIMEGAIAVKNGLTAGQIINTIHPHPTLSEAAQEAAHGIFGEPLHHLKLKR